MRAARSVCWAAGDIGLGIVHAIKYRGWYRVANDMAERMARLDWPVDVVEERRALIPVPLSLKRLRRRGYNQSECLADALSRRLAIPVWTDALTRTRHTETQTQLTTRGPQAPQRFGGFAPAVSALTRRLRVQAHVVVVNDVVTTTVQPGMRAPPRSAMGERNAS